MNYSMTSGQAVASGRLYAMGWSGTCMREAHRGIMTNPAHRMSFSLRGEESELHLDMPPRSCHMHYSGRRSGRRTQKVLHPPLKKSAARRQAGLLRFFRSESLFALEARDRVILSQKRQEKTHFSPVFSPLSSSYIAGVPPESI